MERDCQFVVVPPRHGQYEEGPFVHQLMVAGDPDPAGAGRGGGGVGGERKRRFTEEQVRSLETTFHARRAKLEPREKAELARELGLQPRQVAIWFQNKRARWRSKQLEHDYAALQAQYDALHARVESLKQEKLALAAQVLLHRSIDSSFLAQPPVDSQLCVHLPRTIADHVLLRLVMCAAGRAEAEAERAARPAERQLRGQRRRGGGRRQDEQRQLRGGGRRRRDARGGRLGGIGGGRVLLRPRPVRRGPARAVLHHPGAVGHMAAAGVERGRMNKTTPHHDGGE
jgi:hypothetical protein